MNGKVAIISGGVSDIGKTIGELFAGKGARLTSSRPPQSGQTAQAFDLGSAILFRFALPEEVTATTLFLDSDPLMITGVP
jgi:hypothetical protein